MRRPITMELMGILKKRLRAWDASPTNQRMVWAVATNLFHGAFRVGELLCAEFLAYHQKCSHNKRGDTVPSQVTEGGQEGARRDCQRVRHQEKHMPSTRLAEMDGHTQTLARLSASFHPKPVQTDFK